MEMPNFNFDLTLYGGDLGFLPGLEAWITTVIKDSVLRCVAYDIQLIIAFQATCTIWAEYCILSSIPA